MSFVRATMKATVKLGGCAVRHPVLAGSVRAPRKPVYTASESAVLEARSALVGRSRIVSPVSLSAQTRSKCACRLSQNSGSTPNPVTEAERRVASDRTPAVDDLAHTVRRHIDLARELRRSDADFRQLFLQYPTGMDGTSQHRHSPFTNGSPQSRCCQAPIDPPATRNRYAIAC